jgi:hypothetical protein
MKTILGREIPKTIKGIVYLCHFNQMVDPPVLTVFRDILCERIFDAFTIYAETPNPPSQLVYGNTYEELCEQLEILHKNMKDEKWLEELAESI